MTRDSKINKRLVALFLLGCVLLNYPILSLVNLKILIFGLPLLYVYLFGVWGLLISLTALVTLFRSRGRPDAPGETGGRELLQTGIILFVAFCYVGLLFVIA